MNLAVVLFAAAEDVAANVVVGSSVDLVAVDLIIGAAVSFTVVAIHRDAAASAARRFFAVDAVRTTAPEDEIPTVPP